MKFKGFYIIFALLMTTTAFTSAAAEPVISPDGTYLFEKRDTCDLFLDVYNPAKGSETTFNGAENRP